VKEMITKQNENSENIFERIRGGALPGSIKGCDGDGKNHIDFDGKK